MKPAKILEADYLDIIYERHNKTYGGYELRKHYNRRLVKASVLMFVSVGLLSSFSVITSRPGEHAATSHVAVVMTQVVIPEKVKVVQEIHPPFPAVQKAVATVANTVPHIEHDQEVPPEKAPVENIELEHVNPGLTTAGGDASGIGAATGPSTGGAVVTEVVKPTPPANWVSQMPVFDGSIEDYIRKHIHYPEAARSANIEGTVMIKFVVNENGLISNAEVVRGIGGGCDEEALHMVSSMPAWKPGKQNGVAVKVYYVLPIRFVLDP